jgi:hypothetical protein
MDLQEFDDGLARLEDQLARLKHPFVGGRSDYADMFPQYLFDEAAV